MKKYIYLLAIVLIACQPKPPKTMNTVSVSILPQKYFVEQIAGNLVSVNVLVPPGSSYHNYEVLASQMKSLSESKIWLQIGLLTFEEMWKEKFAEMNQNMKIVNCSEGVDLLAGSCEEDHDHDHAHHEAFDPHIWAAPAESKIVAKNTFLALKAAFPEHAQTFEANYAKFDAHIDSVSAQISAKLAPFANRGIMIFHPTLGYFARQFGMNQIALEMDGKDPSPKHMKEMVDTAKAQNIRIVFIQKEFDSENALQLAREIGGEVVTIDPLDYNWDKQMLDIAEKIASQK